MTMNISSTSLRFKPRPNRPVFPTSDTKKFLGNLQISRAKSRKKTFDLHKTFYVVHKTDLEVIKQSVNVNGCLLNLQTLCMCLLVVGVYGTANRRGYELIKSLIMYCGI